jgi:phospholipase C
MMNQIEHVVHLMFENRSLDNTLGFLYTPNDLPQHNLPAANPTTYDGLAFGGPYANDTSGGQSIAVHDGTDNYEGRSRNVVPTPNSGEPYDEVHEQIFGGGTVANMSGFVTNYEKQGRVNAANVRQIMDSYATTQLKALSAIARAFAVSDAWFCSMPTQTWPNRGFAHAGSSDGHVVNRPFIPWPIDTIFTVLENAGISWAVYHDTLYTPALTMIQFAKHFLLGARFARFKHFLTRCNAPADAPASMKLPAYTFLEPRFIAERLLRVHHSTDYHPPHNVQHAEKYLVDVYNAVKSSPYRDKILLIITFDEHGGTYDHVVPPGNAAPPEPRPVARNGFTYDRFGVRVPAILVSSWVKPGTVFRAPAGSTPYDHTSVLATLRDWKQIPADQFLPSPRIAAAPTLDAVLTESVPNTDWPDITSLWHEEAPLALESIAAATDEDDLLLEQPPDDLEESMVAATEYYLRHRDQPPEAVELESALEAMPREKAERLPTRRAAMEELRRMMLTER